MTQLTSSTYVIRSIRPRLRGAHLLLAALIFMVLAPIARADAPLPTPIVGPRLSPPAIPHPVLIDPAIIADHLESPPASALEAAAFNEGRGQEAPGRGIHQVETETGSGLTLFIGDNVCNDFNRRPQWSAPRLADIATNWYGGWAPFAVDNHVYRSANVVFAQERVVGPGRYYAGNQHSAKIASSQPYAAGFGSPLLNARPGATVTVSVKYLIFDHGGKPLDWASLGVKPDATGEVAEYVNGYVRGRWAEMTHTVTAGPTGQIMVLLQAHSPAALNSNIYFDDVKIQINNRYVNRCFLAND